VTPVLRLLPPLAWTALLAAAPAAAHEALLEVGPGLAAATAADPRGGNLQARGELTLEPSEAVAVFASLQYTRDFATRTAETASSGSDVFLVDVGVSWMPGDAWLTAFTLLGSPPSRQRNATTVSTAAGQSADVVVDARTWSLGGLLAGSYTTGFEGPFDSTLDVSLGLTRLDVTQQLELGATPRAQAIATFCQAPRNQRTALCSLVAGAATPLLQGRLGAGYTATLARDTDLGVQVDGYLYDRDPLAVGYFSLVALGRAELGQGVPLLPLVVSVKPSAVQRLGPVTLRAAYQLGVYAGGRGTNHALTAKVTWRATPALQLWLSATGQLDVTPGGVSDPGLGGLVGALIGW
jgi:hypothetical protein